MKTQSNKKSRKPAKKTAAQHRDKRGKHATAKAAGKPKTATSLTAVGTGVRALSKLTTVIEMLQRPSGATISDMSKATAWLPHTVRGFLSGTIKKKRGLKLTSEKADGVRVYRIEA